MERIDISTAGKTLGKIVETLPPDGVALTRYGKTVALLVPPLVSTEGTPEEHDRAKELASRMASESLPDGRSFPKVERQPTKDPGPIPPEGKVANLEYEVVEADAQQVSRTRPRLGAVQPVGLSKSQQAGGKYDR